MDDQRIDRFLKLKDKTAFALVAKGEIPGFKVGGSWRFSAAEIERWVIEQQKKHTGKLNR